MTYWLWCHVLEESLPLYPSLLSRFYFSLSFELLLGWMVSSYYSYFGMIISISLLSWRSMSWGGVALRDAFGLILSVDAEIIILFSFLSLFMLFYINELLRLEKLFEWLSFHNFLLEPCPLPLYSLSSPFILNLFSISLITFSVFLNSSYTLGLLYNSWSLIACQSWNTVMLYFRKSRSHISAFWKYISSSIYDCYRREARVYASFTIFYWYMKIS